jgi:hypothetical protein
MSTETENIVKEPSALEVAKIKSWYKEQISMAKLRTELAELMAREAKAGAERLHFLGSIAAMQGPQPKEGVDQDIDNETPSQNTVEPQSNEEPQDEDTAVVRSIFQ